MTKSLTFVKKKKEDVCGYPGHKGMGLAWLPVWPECCVFDAFFLVDRGVWDKKGGGLSIGSVCSDGYVPSNSRNPIHPSATTGDCWREFLKWETSWSSLGRALNFSGITRGKDKIGRERGDLGAKGGKENKVKKFIGL